MLRFVHGLSSVPGCLASFASLVSVTGSRIEPNRALRASLALLPCLHSGLRPAWRLRRSTPAEWTLGSAPSFALRSRYTAALQHKPRLGSFGFHLFRGHPNINPGPHLGSAHALARVSRVRYTSPSTLERARAGCFSAPASASSTLADALPTPATVPTSGRPRQAGIEAWQRVTDPRLPFRTPDARWYQI